MTTPKDERVLDAIKNDAMMEEAIASAELAQAPKDERTWEGKQRHFVNGLAAQLNPSNDTMAAIRLFRSELPAFLHTHTTALAEEVVAKKYPTVFNDYREGYNHALDDALAIIRKHLTPDNR